MADQPFERRPGHREHKPQRNPRRHQPQPHDKPKHDRHQERQDRDRREVAEGGQRREVPQCDYHPIEHERIGHQSVPPAPPKRGAGIRVGYRLPDEQHGRRDREETQDRQGERRITEGKRDRSQDDEQDQTPAAHNKTSRPSSAER